MAIVIKPKNLFTRDISRLNDNNYKTVNDKSFDVSDDYVDIFDEDISFFIKTGSTTFNLNAEAANKYGYSYITPSSGAIKRIAYKKVSYNLKDNEYDYDVFIRYI